MTTVTLDTLSNTATIFIRGVLRQNITDTQSPARAGTLWIFKGQPEKRTIDFPYIVIDIETRKNSNLTFSRIKKRNDEFIIGIQVWTDDLDDRDTLADEIIKVLSTPTSADSGGDTIASKYLHFKECDDSDNDSFKTETKMVRLKTMSVTFVYGGN